MPDTDFFHTNSKNYSFDFEDFIKTEIGLGNNSDSGIINFLLIRI